MLCPLCLVDALDQVAEENLGRHLCLHYSFKKYAPFFASGLRGATQFVTDGMSPSEGSYATEDVYSNGWDAHWYLALPSYDIQDAAYIVMPKKGFDPIGPSVVTRMRDAAGRNLDGGGHEYLFYNGSGGPGTVFGPIPMPISAANPN
jgi:hypothetical protein